MNRLLLLFFLLCGFSSCVYVENSYEAADFKIEIPDHLTLEVSKGIVEHIETDEDTNRVYHVYFDAVQGGETYFLGLLKVRESDGHRGNRLKVLNEEGKAIEAYSISYLEQLQSELPGSSAQIKLDM